MTFLAFLTVMLFMVTKVISIYDKQEVDMMSIQVEGALTYNDKFDSSNGLFIAAALTEYDQNPEIIEIPEKYGEL